MILSVPSDRFLFKCSISAALYMGPTGVEEVNLYNPKDSYKDNICHFFAFAFAFCDL